MLPPPVRPERPAFSDPAVDAPHAAPPAVTVSNTTDTAAIQARGRTSILTNFTKRKVSSVSTIQSTQ
ncbi:unannotated protein [freshwater metagenome]|uniref:Unannotated protein n=1 Tax=freshwater metagenome TaxID=449393 RepID=A0A6J6DFF7_9ZZZZ